METREALFSRRSIRVYKNKPIEDEVLQEIIEAGLAAPSAVNLQPWYFVFIRNPEQMERLTKIMNRISIQIEPALKERFPEHPKVVDESVSFIRQMGGAPVCVLVFQLEPDYNKTKETIVQSVAAAIENLLLAATDKGIGSCWLTAPLETGMGAEIRDAFAPGKGDLLAMITLGYSDQTPKAPRRKDGRYIIL